MTIPVVDDTSDTGSYRIIRRRKWSANTVDELIRVVPVMITSVKVLSATETDEIQKRPSHHLVSTYPNARMSPLPLMFCPTCSLMLKPNCLLRSSISVVPIAPPPRKTACFA